MTDTHWEVRLMSIYNTILVFWNTEASERDRFRKGDIVTVLGPSATRGHHIVQKGDVILHVPYTRMAIQVGTVDLFNFTMRALNKSNMQ